MEQIPSVAWRSAALPGAPWRARWRIRVANSRGDREAVASCLYKSLHNTLKNKGLTNGIGLRAFAPVVVLSALQAGASPVDTAELEMLLNGMKSFRAEFHQTVAGDLGEVLQTATGRMHLQRPGRLRWEVDEPYPQLVLADGDSVWIYDPDLEQVTVQPLAETVEGSPAVFLTGASADLEEHFAVVEEDDGDGRQGKRRFVLTPRDGSPADASSGSLFQRITVTFSARGVLSNLDVVDHLGHVTATAFTAAEVNPVLESSLFGFEVPEGVDVIGDIPANPALR